MASPTSPSEFDTRSQTTLMVSGGKIFERHQSKGLFDVALFTSLRRTEAASLKWSDIDFAGRVLTIRAEVAKNHHEHRLPITDFLFVLLTQRKLRTGNSEFVFPGREGKHMVDSDHVISSVAKKCDYPFTLDDLRRTFLTTAEILDVPHYALKKLANHVSRRDVTGGYIVVNVERMRVYMTRISEHFLNVLGIDQNDFEKHRA